MLQGSEGKLCLEISTLGGETISLFAHAHDLVSTITQRYQKLKCCKNVPTLSANAQVLDPKSTVKDAGTLLWQAIVSNQGLSLADWKASLSLWTEQFIERREVGIKHDRGFQSYEVQAVPVGADRLLVFHQFSTYSAYQIRPDEFWLIGASEGTGNDVGKAGYRQLSLPVEAETILLQTHFDGVNMTVLTVSNAVLRFALKDALVPDLNCAYFETSGAPHILDDAASFPAMLGLEPGPLLRDARNDFAESYRIETFEEWIMPTEVRRGYRGEGAKIYAKASGKQIGVINADSHFGGTPLWTDERILLDVVSPGEDGWRGLQVFDLRTGKLVRTVKEVGGWYDQSCRGLLPGELQGFFTVAWDYPSQHRGDKDCLCVSFFVPDPYVSQADKDWEEAAGKAEKVSFRQATQAEKERRADLASQRDQNPIYEKSLAVERALSFCKSVRIDCAAPPPNSIESEDGTTSAPKRSHNTQRARHQKRGMGKPIKHTIQSINLFAGLGLQAPTTTEQLQIARERLEALLVECQSDIVSWHQQAQERSRIKDYIIHNGTAPAGAALLRLAFGIGS